MTPREKILAAVSYWRSQGWSISPGVWSNREMKACCPLAAIAGPNLRVNDGMPGLAWRSLAREVLGGSLRDMEAFVLGFDGVVPYDRYGMDSEWYKLGSELRAELLP